MSNQGVICPNCGVITFDSIDIENIEEYGECCICESCRRDYQDYLESVDELED